MTSSFSLTILSWGAKMDEMLLHSEGKVYCRFHDGRVKHEPWSLEPWGDTQSV